MLESSHNGTTEHRAVGREKNEKNALGSTNSLGLTLLPQGIARAVRRVSPTAREQLGHRSSPQLILVIDIPRALDRCDLSQQSRPVVLRRTSALENDDRANQRPRDIAEALFASKRSPRN